MADYFTSDLHFMHYNIIHGNSMWGNREFSSPEEMGQYVVEAINETVGPDDTLYILGDVCMGNWEKSKEYARAIQCKNVVLIRGNHDSERNVRFFAEELGWKVHQYLFKTIRHNGKRYKIAMFHFPIAEWENSRHGSIHLHGHTHGTMEPFKLRMMDVGVDTRESYAPYSMDEIVTLMCI